MAAARQWLAEIGLLRASATDGNRPSSNPSFPRHAQNLGILAFEAAKAMSRLLFLHASLTDDELHSLRCSVFRTHGVAYLNSCDEAFLIHLAYTEKAEDLDRAALFVAHLAKKCCNPELQRFDRLYDDVKLGAVDFSKSMIPAKKLQRKITKMEKLVSATSALFAGLELLSVLEVSERKLQALWKHSGSLLLHKHKSGLFDKKTAWQRRQVKRMRAASLWNQPVEKIVQLMSQMVCNVFARLCIVFGRYVSDLPQVVLDDKNSPLVVSPKLEPLLGPNRLYASGPLDRWASRSTLAGKFSRHLKQHRRSKSDKTFLRTNTGIEMDIQETRLRFTSSTQQRTPRKRKRIMEEASTMTVGHAALALLYANVIIIAEKILNHPNAADDDMREGLFYKLPDSVRKSLKAKMRDFLASPLPSDESLVVSWLEDVKKIMEWLLPMARDTVQWQAERNFDRQQLELRPTVLLLQTLYFSDRQKTDEAITEVLVGLSRILICKDQFPDLFARNCNGNYEDDVKSTERESRSVKAKRHQSWLDRL